MPPYDRAIVPDQVISAEGQLLAGVGPVQPKRFQAARAVHPTAGTWAGVYRSTEPIQFRWFDEPSPTSSEGIILEELLRKIHQLEDEAFTTRPRFR